MKDKRLFRTLTTVAVFAAFVCVLSPPAVGAADNKPDSKGSDKSMVGTYLLVEDVVEGTPMRLLTLTSDGTFVATSTEEPEHNFSTAHGAWKKTGPTETVATSLDFDFDDDSMVRITYIIEFTDKVKGRYQNLEGEFLGELFPSGVDPLDPNSVPTQTWTVPFSGRRVSAD